MSSTTFAGRVARAVFCICIWVSLSGSADLGALLPDGTDEDAVMMLERGRELAESGRAREALPFYEQTLDMAEAQLEEQSAPLAFLLHELAAVYRDAGRADRAEAELKRALGILEQGLGPEHREILPVVADLADLLADTDRHGEAEAAYQRTWTLLRLYREAGDPEIVATLGQLALLADMQGRGDEAEGLYRQSIRLADDGGQEGPALAAALNNLASIYHRQGNLDQAEPLYRRALDLRQRFLGSRHWVVAVSLSDLALLLYRKGMLEEAQRYADQAADLLQPYCGALNAEADGVRRSARELCRDTSTLQQRLSRSAEQPDPIAVQNRVPEPSPEPVQARGNEGGIYRVQLAARQDLEQAQSEVQQLRDRFPSLLGNLASRLETADLGTKGTWHRLQFGTFSTHEQAQNLCDALRAEGLSDCWVAGP